MATPHMRMRADIPESPGKRKRSSRRLLDADRSYEIFPVLLEEIVALGHTRAFIGRVNFDTSEIASVGFAELLPHFSAALPVLALRHGESAGAGVARLRTRTGSFQD